MDDQKSDRLTLPKIDSNSLSADSMRSIGDKPIPTWEEPDFEEFDLCMEVTAYVYYWQ